jgi:hypothetical protein
MERHRGANRKLIIMKNILTFLLLAIYIFPGVVIGLGTNMGLLGGVLIVILIRALSCVYYYFKPFSRKRFVWVTILLFFLIIFATPRHISTLGNQKIDKWQQEMDDRVAHRYNNQEISSWSI